MERPLALVAILVGTLTPLRARAEAPLAIEDVTPAPGIEAALNVAAAAPVGQSVPGTGFRDYQDWQESVGIGLGWRANLHWYVGAYGSLGYVARDRVTCEAAGTCWGRSLRGGVEVRYFVLPRRELTPWISAGAGYEDSHQYRNAVGLLTGRTGPEILNLYVGLDLRLTHVLALGPFIGGSLGTFQRAHVGEQPDVAVEDTVFHGWLTAGVRGAFNL